MHHVGHYVSGCVKVGSHSVAIWRLLLRGTIELRTRGYLGRGAWTRGIAIVTGVGVGAVHGEIGGAHA